MDTADLSQKYPHLLQEVIWQWGPTLAKFIPLIQAPPLHLIGNVNIVPRVGIEWVVLQHKDGSWDIPGGTLEPGEGYLEAIQRELMEEAGARLMSFSPIGAWHCHSLARSPYRSHLPFPEFYRLVGVGKVRIEAAPENPPGGEGIATVKIVQLETAKSLFISSQRYDLADLYQFAADHGV